MNYILRILKKLWNAFTAIFRWYFRLYRGRRWYTRVLIFLLSLPVFLLLFLGMVDINFLWLFGRSPGFFGESSIMHPHTAIASEVYSADGKILGRFFSENRTPVEYKDINPVFWNALIDTEDERFYDHIGIDPVGMAGALKDAIVRREPRGASTITQQLAKNIFRMRTGYSTGLLGSIPGIRMLIIKSKEWIVAAKLEMVYSKEEILTMYANTVDFGCNAFGIKTASRVYFNTTPDSLTVEQAATLVGTLKGTTVYNPVTHPDRALQRRNQVLLNMVNHGHLTRNEYDSIKATPLTVQHTTEDHFSGRAPYFRQAVADHLKEWCMENEIDLYTDGLKIYTTVDSRMQQYAEQAVRRHMQQLQKNFNAHWNGRVPWRDEDGNEIPHFVEDIARKLPLYEQLQTRYNGNEDSVWAALNRPHTVKLFDYTNGRVERNMSTLDSIRYMTQYLHTGFVAIEPQTRAVKAWVGDIDFNAWQYDKVKAQRQPGSTFKLFTYAEAMNQGLTPCDRRVDEEISVQVWNPKLRTEVTWTPQNASGSFSGDTLPLRTAFAKSVNSVAARLGQELGIGNILKCASDMGIRSQLKNEPSVVLGSSDVNLLELTNAYATVAANGHVAEPILVTRIEDRKGRVIYEASAEPYQALPYATAYYMQRMLIDVVYLPGGTGQGLLRYVGDVPRTDFGGKTGTSNNHSDAWFVGVSPKLVVGCWVGGEYRSIHFRTAEYGQGARAAMPICGEFLRSVFHDSQFASYRQRFHMPANTNVESSDWDCDPYPPKKEEEPDDSLGLIDEQEEWIEGDEYLQPIGNL